MANPIIPSGSRNRRNVSGRSEDRESNPDILDLDNGHHTAYGDWVEDNPTNIGVSLDDFARSQLNQINSEMTNDLGRMHGMWPGTSRRPALESSRRQHDIDDERRRREEAVAEEQRRIEAEKKAKEDEQDKLEKESKKNIKNAISGLRLD